MMTGTEYRKTIASLGLRPVAAARFLGVDATTSRRWSTDQHPIPKPVAMLLRTMRHHNLSPDHIEWVRTKQ